MNAYLVGDNDMIIESLVIDGIEYVETPQVLTENVISIGAYNWNSRLADFINDLEIPDFYAIYPTEEELDTVAAIICLEEPELLFNKPTNAIRLVHLANIDFRLVQMNHEGTISKLTKDNSESLCDLEYENCIQQAEEQTCYMFFRMLCEDV